MSILYFPNFLLKFCKEYIVSCSAMFRKNDDFSIEFPSLESPLLGIHRQVATIASSFRGVLSG